MQKYRGYFLIFAFLTLLIIYTVPSKAQTEWQPNTSYAVGDQVTYNGHLYRCLEAHTSQVGWEPSTTPALWQDLASADAATASVTPGATDTMVTPPTATSSGSSGGPACWTPWEASMAYNGGAQVSYNGDNWTAKWWTQNEAPSATTPWNDNGPCDSGSSVNPTPTFVPPTNTPISASTATVIPSGNAWPRRYFAPYVDTTLIPTSLSQMSTDSGAKYFILAFINNGGNCTALWAGHQAMNSGFLTSDIANMRNAGGDVMPSFGGYNTDELALRCPDVSTLQAQYQAVIDAYNFTHLDFNIEGDNLNDTAANDRRNRAIAGLQATARQNSKNLVISYTISVATSGLLQNSLDLLNNAVADGVDVGIVNIMAMDYGASGVAMADAATQAMNATESQLAAIFPGKSSAQLWQMLGIMPMIGMNDSPGETFTLSDASTLLAFVQANNSGELSMWSSGRDVPCSGGNVVSPICSGVAQSNYQFSGIFSAFTQ